MLHKVLYIYLYYKLLKCGRLINHVYLKKSKYIIKKIGKTLVAMFYARKTRKMGFSFYSICFTIYFAFFERVEVLLHMYTCRGTSSEKNLATFQVE